MKKVVRAVILPVLVFCLFIACKNYTADIEDYLSYWSSEASIADYTFDPPPQTDAEGVRWFSSKTAVTVTFTVNNPKNFNFKMPEDSGAPADIVTFPRIRNEPDKNAAIALQPGIDYEFKKISNTKLALTYTPVFLQKHEWGRGDITPSIILYITDGRHFEQAVQGTLKVNTPPPAITHYTLAKTKTNDPGKDAYYVLCLQVPDMDVRVTGELLHKDIVGIEINGTTYSLSVNEAQHTFIKPEDTAFLNITDVEKLEADAGNIPSGWVLYFKTDVPVKDGSAKKDYTVKLTDVKGLTSPELKAATKPNTLQQETRTVTFNLAGGNIGGNTNAITMTGLRGTPFTKPADPIKEGYTFNGWDPALPAPLVFPVADTAYTAQWMPKTYTVTFKVDGEHGSLTGTYEGADKTASGSTERKFESVPHNSTITFTATPDSGYEVDGWTDAVPDSSDNKNASLTVQDNVTVTVKFKQQAAPITTWEALRTAVQDASDGAVIEIANDLTYGFDSASSIIEVKKNITIKSKGGNTYTLNAGGKGADGGVANPKVIGIFEVKGNKTLKLEHLMLTKAEKYAVYVAQSGSLTMKNVTIKDCKTQYNAAGIYFNKGKDLTLLENCIIEKCKGKGVQSSGGIDIEEPTGTVSIKDTTIKDCAAQANGGGINLYNGNNVQCKLENVKVDNCSALRGGGIHAKAGTLTISGGLFRSNAASGSIANGGGGAIYSEDAEITITECTIGGDDTNNGNYAVQGGGIFVSEDAKCTLNAGTKISGNTAMQMGADDGNGGGIFVNRASSGAAAGILTINGAEMNHVIISGNTADYGGGLYNYGKANIKYAEIQGNSVEHNGGGMFNAGTCMMDGVTLQNNKAESEGGGIYSNKELTLENTTVTGNEATTSGGAIQIATADSVFNMSGSTIITLDASKNDIYLTNDAFITLTGELTATGKIARITLNSSGGYQNNREIVKGDSDFTIPSGYDTKFEITDKIGSPQHWKLIYQSKALKLKQN